MLSEENSTLKSSPFKADIVKICKSIVEDYGSSKVSKLAGSWHLFNALMATSSENGDIPTESQCNQAFDKYFAKLDKIYRPCNVNAEVGHRVATSLSTSRQVDVKVSEASKTSIKPLGLSHVS